MVCRAGARRNVRLAKAPKQVQRKPRPVIGDLDGDRRAVPEGGDADLAPGELDGVLNQVVEPVHDLGAAPDERLLGAGLRRRRKDQLHPLLLVQRPGGLDQRRDRQPGIGRPAVVLRLLRELGEDPAAALGLAQQQRRVLGMRAVVGQIAHQLLGDDGDRRERAAELVRRRRGQRADRRDPLLAGERQLGRGHRVAQPPRLLRDAPGIAADEHRREHQRHPDAEHQLGRKHQRLGAPGQRHRATGRAR